MRSGRICMSLWSWLPTYTGGSGSSCLRCHSCISTTVHPRSSGRQHQPEPKAAVVATRDEAGHARRLDAEVAELDRGAAHELHAPPGALAADAHGDRGAGAV